MRARPAGKSLDGYAADDRHRPDVHLLGHAGDPDGDRLRLRLRSGDPRRRLQLRTGDGRPPDADPDPPALPAPAHAACPWDWTTRAGWTIPTSTWPTTCTGSRCRAPGGEAEFRAKVAEVMGRPLTPEQPPWEMHVLEGMADGMVGLIAKVHHAVIDGVAGAEMLAKLLDLTPEGSAVTEPCPPWVPPRLPSSDAVDDRRPAQLRPQPHPGHACGARNRPHRGAPGPLRGGRPARSGVDPAGRARHLRVARARSHEPSPSPSWTWRRCGRSRPGSARRSTTWCSPSARARCARTWPRTMQDVDSPLVAVVPVSVRDEQDDGRARQPPLRHVRAALERPADAARAPADRDRGQCLVQGAGACRRLRPDGDPADRGGARRRWPSR